jgi:hypothetical protein
MKILLASNMRDEKNILEWAAHHTNIGFNHIFIIDHCSVEPIENTTHSISNITVKRSNNLKEKKISFMNDAIAFGKDNDFDWLLYLDADEYLYLTAHSVQSFISNINSEATSICVPWLCFGSNYLESCDNSFLIDKFIRSDLTLNCHVKTLTKLNTNPMVLNPHCFKNEPNLPYTCTNIKTKSKSKCLNFLNENFNSTPAFIAHYIIQDYQTFVKRKVNRRRDDVHCFYKEYQNLSKSDVDRMHNEHINKFMVDKYFNNIINKINIWKI